MLKFLLIKIVSPKRLFRSSQLLKVLGIKAYLLLLAFFPDLLYAQSKTPHRNEIELSDLKKQKLAIKDELERINSH